MPQGWVPQAPDPLLRLGLPRIQAVFPLVPTRSDSWPSNASVKIPQAAVQLYLGAEARAGMMATGTVRFAYVCDVSTVEHLCQALCEGLLSRSTALTVAELAFELGALEVVDQILVGAV